ncbi:SAM-dependent DNA methyltransferase, partial [Klebsiella pneumoniae]|nr:SAM-dependent DNA methyltransferase [Klebsiella pneumoniae]
MPRPAKTGTAKTNGATLGFEAKLWAAADKLGGNLDAADYKHVVLGLIFLKYISDAFDQRYREVLAEFGPEAAEDRDEYTAEG